MMFYAFLGCLCKLHDRGDLDDVQEIAGSSAGSLLGLVYLIGRKDIPTFVNECMNVNLSSLRIDLKNFIQNYGFIDMNKAKDIVSQFCFKFIRMHDITFKQLYDTTNVKFHVSAFSLDKRAVEYLSVDTAPHMSVVDAVCMSMCVPFIFSPFKGHIDGSISEDIPYIPFIDKDREDVFVIHCEGSDMRQYNSLWSYFKYIMNIYYYIRHKCSIAYPTIKVDRNIDMFNFKMSSKERTRLYIHGYDLLI